MSSVTVTVLLSLLTMTTVAHTVTFDCDTARKNRDLAKFIECLTSQNTSLTSFVSRKCPPGTCFNEALQICSSNACKDLSLVTLPSPEKVFVKQQNVNVWLKPATATESDEEDVVLGGLKPPSILERPKKKRVLNYVFNPSNKRESHHGLHKPDHSNEPLWTPTSAYYNCTARRYNCTGPGLFGDPMDNTIFYKCRWSVRKNKWRAVCFPCNEKWIKCFSNKRKACIPCDDTDSEREFTTEVISESTSYDCVGYQAFPCSQLGFGLWGHPGDQSIAVLCSNKTFEEGEWLGGCLSCSRQNHSCFIEGIGQCVDDCTIGAQHPYDCSYYKLDKSQPCKEEGLFATPLDNTTYFDCIEAEDGKSYPECRPCKRGWFFDPYKKECIGEDEKPEPELTEPSVQMEPRMDFEVDESQLREVVAPVIVLNDSSKDSGKSNKHGGGGYDCRAYNDFLFPCRATGYFAHEQDPTVYFSCWPLPSGGYTAACYTCNKKYHTCFDDVLQACLTVEDNLCGSKAHMKSRTDKGEVGPSRTWDCDGYSKKSFPCHFYAEGDFAMPGDTSVYITCEDLNGDGIPEYSNCHTCNNKTEACWNSKLGKCVNYCSGKLEGEDKLMPQGPPPKSAPSTSTATSTTITTTTAVSSTVTTATSSPTATPSTPTQLTTERSTEHKRPNKLTRTKIGTYVPRKLFPYGSWYHPPHIFSVPRLSYDCKAVMYTCVQPGLYVNGLDPSVWFECYRGRRYNDWSVKCHVCPRYTCYDMKWQACIMNCRRITEYWRYNRCRDPWDRWTTACDWG